MPGLNRRLDQYNPDRLALRAMQIMTWSDEAVSMGAQHSHVLALEAVADFIRELDTTMEELPEDYFEPTTRAHILHIRNCDICLSGVKEFLAMRPSDPVNLDEIPRATWP